MTGGGARGAYQAGVLKRMGEIKAYKHRPIPFQILAGASAGAINVTALATRAKDFSQITRLLAALWARLSIEKVYRTDLGSLAPKAARWIRDLALGGVLGGGRADSLLDASPLQHFLARRLHFSGIQESIDQGHLYALAITATDYFSGKAYTFIQGQKGHPTWQKSRRVALPSQISLQHVCASSAIPILFQPILVPTDDGPAYFGDGCLRLHAPLSPAIRLGAHRIMAIGVRSQVADENRKTSQSKATRPPIAQVLGVALNAIFLDSLDSDVEHLERMNSILSSIKEKYGALPKVDEPMDIIETLALKPSLDLAEVADTYSSKLPMTLRYFLDGLGTSRSETADLISYLLFDSNYTRALIELGYQDAQSRIDEIEEFLAKDKK